MSFNINKYKNKDAQDAYIDVLTQKGAPSFYLAVPGDKKESLEKEIAKFNKTGVIAKSLEEYKKPIRLKFKSPHSNAFNDAVRIRAYRNQMLAKGVDAARAALESNTIDALAGCDKAARAINDGIKSGAMTICELCIDWEGFTDDEGNLVDYDPDILLAVLLEPANTYLYTQLIKAIEEKKGFFTL